MHTGFFSLIVVIMSKPLTLIVHLCVVDYVFLNISLLIFTV